MSFQGLHHLVLLVDSVPEDEQFYQELFDMEILFREGSLNDEPGTVPDHMGWEEAISAGIEPYMAFLRRDDFTLAVAESTQDISEKRLDHIALAVSESDAESVAERAVELGCSVSRRNAPHQLFVEDSHDIEWELNTTSPPPSRAFDTLPV